VRGEARHDDPQRYQNEREQDRSMTTQRNRGQEDWVGYIQPYRYFGPGYRGVGYYSVFYQGSDPNQAGDEMDEPRTQYQQRSPEYGQGRTQASYGSTSRGWDQRRSWEGTEPAGAWGDRAREFGKFAGRGPKGYQRSDDRIREDVSDRLTEHPDIDASEIEVNVSGGVVTLAGEVDSRWGKRLAEDIAEGVGGVRDVMNHLSVSGQFGGRESESRGQRTSRESSSGTTESTPPRQTRNGRRPTTANR
jgi:osmotically-inducible protein OsmY